MRPVAEGVEILAGDQVGGAQGTTEMAAASDADRFDDEAAQFAALAGDFAVECRIERPRIGPGWPGPLIRPLPPEVRECG